MSLEKHIETAARALLTTGGRSGDYDQLAPDQRAYWDESARAVVNAFLSSLADDPPEEMVEAAGQAVKDWTDRDGEERLPSIMRECLSAALREAVKENTD